MEQLNMPYFHVLGNHDFWVQDRYKRDVPRRLGLSSPYYAITHKGWRFIVLDGNEISLHAWPQTSSEHQDSVAWKNTHAPEAKDWNGALGTKQLAWFSSELAKAKASQLPVAVLCHFPIYPVTDHELWDRSSVLNVMDDYDQVRVWIAGHHHAGSYGYRNGVHHLTLCGMLDSDETAWSLVQFAPSALHVQGFGRQPSYQLDLP